MLKPILTFQGTTFSSRVFPFISFKIPLRGHNYKTPSTPSLSRFYTKRGIFIVSYAFIVGEILKPVYMLGCCRPPYVGVYTSPFIAQRCNPWGYFQKRRIFPQNTLDVYTCRNNSTHTFPIVSRYWTGNEMRISWALS